MFLRALQTMCFMWPTASVSDVLQILFLEDGLLAFYSAKTQDVLLSVRSLIDDLILCIFIKRKESDFQTKKLFPYFLSGTSQMNLPMSC